MNIEQDIYISTIYLQAKLTGLEVHTGMGLLITISLDKTIKVIRLSSMEEVY